VQADDLNDAWGTPFEFELTPKGPKLTSPGGDKALGTEDDMVYVSGRLQETEAAAPKKDE
jgi:hypothetical protein